MLSELSASIFINELLRVSASIVWKNNYLVIQYEGATTPYDVDMYISANKGLLSFETIHSFDYSIINGVGITPSSLVQECVEDKNKIPYLYRDACVALKINQINDTYVEKNDYYRMMYGLPNMDDKEFVYCTGYPDIDYTIPIHMLSKSDRIFLEYDGYFNQLIKDYPDKKYIAYLGKKNIVPYKARIVDRFSMLYCATSEYDTLVDDFKELYEQCRLYTIKQFYTEAYRNTQSEYEGFVGMSILFMTIQMMHYKYLDADITRNFYDLDSLKLIYSSYGVPFYPSIPLQYHKLIVRDINRLLSYKGSSRVLFDLFKIFDYGSMEIFQYYIFKIHKFGVDGNPIFIYNEDGSFNNEKMFDINFVKVPFNGDLYLNLTDTANQVDYTLLTTPDKYWIEDQDLKDVLYNEEYNFIESKYMGIQLMFDITRIMFETSYFMKMLMDNKKSTSRITLFVNNLNKNIPLFDMIIYAYALICRKFEYAGNIPADPEQVAAVYGFNFKDDLSVIKSNIKADKYLKNDTVLYSLISDMNINILSDVHIVFKNIDDLDKYLSNKLYSVTNKDEYYAYRNIQTVLMTTKLIPDVFRKSNGEIATTYEDLLRDVNVELYNRIVTDGLDYSAEIDYVLSTLKSLSSNLEYIEIVESMNVSVLIEYLFKMIAFFKSAKSELTDFNVVYTMNSSTLNMIKLLSNVFKIESTMSFEDNLLLKEDIFMIYDMNNFIDSFKLYDKYNGSERAALVKDQLNKLTDKINLVIQEQQSKFKSLYYLEDNLIPTETNSTIKSGGIFYDRMTTDSLKYYFTIHHTDIMSQFKDLCDKINLISTYLNEVSKIDLVSMLNTEAIDYLHNKSNNIIVRDKVNEYGADTTEKELCIISETISSIISSMKRSLLTISESLITGTIIDAISDNSIVNDTVISIIDNLFKNEDLLYRERIDEYMTSNFKEIDFVLDDDIGINNILQRSGILGLSDTVRKENQITE